MLLQSETIPGEIYVEDREITFREDEKPQLWQMVEAPVADKRRGIFGNVEDYSKNPTWENIETGEIVSWGTHCFTTIERIKKQYANLDSIKNQRRVNFVIDAYELIKRYETKQNNAMTV